MFYNCKREYFQGTIYTKQTGAKTPGLQQAGFLEAGTKSVINITFFERA